VEAQAAGKPVIALAQGGAAETVVHGETGILFGRQAVDELVEALRQAEAHRFDPEAIRRHAERFSTERFEDEFRTLLEDRLGRPARRTAVPSGDRIGG